MKLVKLAAPTWVENPFAGPGAPAGEVRHPADGMHTVTDAFAKHLAAEGLLADKAVDLPDMADSDPTIAKPAAKRG